MDNKEFLETPLGSAIVKAIENMVFEPVELDEAFTSASPRNDTYWASLPIRKPVVGELILDTSRLYARKLAEELYSGQTEELSDSLVCDVLAEMLNTIAGGFMKELVSAEQEFELGLPTTGTGMKPTMAAPVTSLRANIGGHYLTAVLTGEDFQQFSSRHGNSV